MSNRSHQQRRRRARYISPFFETASKARTRDRSKLRTVSALLSEIPEISMAQHSGRLTAWGSDPNFYLADLHVLICIPRLSAI